MAAMNTGTARTAPLSSRSTTDKPQPRSTTDKPQSQSTTDKPQPRSTTGKPQPTQSGLQAGQANNDENTQEWKGSETYGHSKLQNGNNYFGIGYPTTHAKQTFSETKCFDNSWTHNGNNIGLKAPNDYDKPPFQPPSQP